jgi:excisionase family DNA binding protein
VLPDLLRGTLAAERQQESPVIEGDLMTVAQVALKLHVTEPTVRRWVSNGELPATRIGPRQLVRVRRADVEKFLYSVRQKGREAADDLEGQAMKIVSRSRTRMK